MYVPQGPARKWNGPTPRRHSGKVPKLPSGPAKRAIGRLTFAPTAPPHQCPYLGVPSTVQAHLFARYLGGSRQRHDHF